MFLFEKLNFFKSELKAQEINVLVIGPTGAGKSSMINLAYLVGQGTKVEELFKLEKVFIKTQFFEGDSTNERDPGDQSKSVSIRPTLYQIKIPDKNSNKLYIINFLDTPGIGELEGIKKDDYHIDAILNTVSNSVFLHGILLVMNGSDSRINTRVQYIISKLFSLIPDSHKDQLYVLMTNTPYSPNLDIDKVLYPLKISSERVFKMDNPIFKFSKQQLGDKKLQERMQDPFKQACETILTLFRKMALSPPIETKDYRIIKTIRDQLKLKLVECQEKSSKIYEKEVFLKKILQNLAQNCLKITDMERNVNQEMTETYLETENTQHQNLICLSCKKCCHEQCGILSDSNQTQEGIIGCLVFSKGIFCSSCQHRYSSHVQLSQKYVQKTRTITKINKELAERIKVLQQNKLDEQKVQETIEEELSELKRQKEKIRDEIANFINELRSICSCFDYMKELRSMIMVLEEIISLNESRLTKEPTNINNIIQLKEDLMYFQEIEKDLITSQNESKLEGSAFPTDEDIRKQIRKDTEEKKTIIRRLVNQFTNLFHPTKDPMLIEDQCLSDSSSESSESSEDTTYSTKIDQLKLSDVLQQKINCKENEVFSQVP